MRGLRHGNVLIGVLPHGPAQLAQIRAHGYYHLPATQATPRRLAAAYVAFFEPKRAFRLRVGRIRFYAPVRGARRVARGDLPGLPPSRRSAAADRYVRLNVGRLRRLPRLVTNPGGRRVLFRLVPLSFLRRARTIEDLKNPGSPPRPPAG